MRLKTRGITTSAPVYAFLLFRCLFGPVVIAFAPTGRAILKPVGKSLRRLPLPATLVPSRSWALKLSGENEERIIAKYIDKVQLAVEAGGGKVNGAALGGIPKPKSINGKLGDFLRRMPDRFQVTVEGTALFVSLTQGGGKGSLPEPQDGTSAESNEETMKAKYLDEIKHKIEAGGGKVNVGVLGSIAKPESINERLVDILRQMPDCFTLEVEGTGLFVSLTQGPGKNSLPESQDPDGTSAESNSTFLLLESVEDLRQAVEKIENQMNELPLDEVPILAVDVEGNLELIQFASVQSDTVIIVDCRVIGARIACEALRPLLATKKYIKIMHDVRKDSMKLNANGIHLDGVLDTQLVAESVFGYPFIGLNRFLERIDLPVNPEKDRMADLMNTAGRDPFKTRPINYCDLLYAAYDVSCLLKSREFIWSKFQRAGIERLLLASSLRVSDAVAFGTRRRICFDKARGYQMSSAEIMRALPAGNRQERCYFGEPVVVDTNLEEVVDILPKTRFDELLNIRRDEENSTFSSEHVSDIVFDIGRRPQCWVQGQRVFLWKEPSRVVCQEDVNDSVHKLYQNGSCFGSDGRAALSNSLNRISAIRGKQGEILGLTIRVGRPVLNISDLLMDLLLGSEKSILILGPPASGKTSLIRDISRRLSQEPQNQRNVVVVDKSNEIGGDGKTPHRSLGLARRMMVPLGANQEKVMIECLENHAPQVMVIDEIGHKRQVSAARTVKDRGVRLIATAHGDLCSLVDNDALNGMVGGVDSVIIGDEAAAAEEKARRCAAAKGCSGRAFCCGDRREPPPKIKMQRVSQPIFDVTVEVSASDKYTWKVVPDTARAVDEILDGLPYHAHCRSREAETGAMFYEFDTDFLSRGETTKSEEELGIDLGFSGGDDQLAPQTSS